MKQDREKVELKPGEAMRLSPFFAAACIEENNGTREKGGVR